jgi:hypothetical protein
VRRVSGMNSTANRKAEGSIHSGSVPGLSYSQHVFGFWLLNGQADLAGFRKRA